MKWFWVDANQDANFDKIKAAGGDGAFFDLRDPRLNLTYLKAVRLVLPNVGVYFAGNWWPEATGAQVADTASELLAKVAPNTDPDFPMVCANLEEHDVAGYLLPFFQRWRQHRPRRVTYWALEAFQGGLFSPPDVAAILHAAVPWCPECYQGEMVPLDPLEVWTNLASAGVPMAAVRGFYDAAHLPPAWSGFAFTQGRLP